MDVYCSAPAASRPNCAADCASLADKFERQFEHFVSCVRRRLSRYTDIRSASPRSLPARDRLRLSRGDHPKLVRQHRDDSRLRRAVLARGDAGIMRTAMGPRCRSRSGRGRGLDTYPESVAYALRSRIALYAEAFRKLSTERKVARALLTCVATRADAREGARSARRQAKKYRRDVSTQDSAVLPRRLWSVGPDRT